MTKIIPVADRVLVKPEEAKDVTASGIIIPGIAKERPNRGEVVAKGDATKYVAIGDVVEYNKEACVYVENGDVEYALIQESKIWDIRRNE